MKQFPNKTMYIIDFQLLESLREGLRRALYKHNHSISQYWFVLNSVHESTWKETHVTFDLAILVCTHLNSWVHRIRHQCNIRSHRWQMHRICFARSFFSSGFNVLIVSFYYIWLKYNAQNWCCAFFFSLPVSMYTCDLCMGITTKMFKLDTRDIASPQTTRKKKTTNTTIGMMELVLRVIVSLPVSMCSLCHFITLD